LLTFHCCNNRNFHQQFFSCHTCFYTCTCRGMTFWNPVIPNFGSSGLSVLHVIAHYHGLENKAKYYKTQLREILSQRVSSIFPFPPFEKGGKKKMQKEECSTSKKVEEIYRMPSLQNLNKHRLHIKSTLESEEPILLTSISWGHRFSDSITVNSEYSEQSITHSE